MAAGRAGRSTPVELTRREARRIAVRAQLLDHPRPTDLLTVLRRLTVVQVDLTTAVAPSADLVLWSRLGQAYQPSQLDDALERRTVLELERMLRPAEDLALFRADMAAWPGRDPDDWEMAQEEWVEANEECRRDILDVLEADGPLPTRALPDTCVVPWRSSGWNNNRNTTMLVHLMERRGEVAVAGREGRDPLWDLAQRVWPDSEVVAWEEAHRLRDARRLASLGVARPRATQVPGEPNAVGTAGLEAVVEGVRGRWRVDPDLLEAERSTTFEGRTVLLSPLDRLVFDRKRMTDLFEFDYQLEMYKPAAARRWGYWALPVLHGDRLVGKVDATADQAAGTLRVDAVHEDEPFDPDLRDAVDAELQAWRAGCGWTSTAVTDEDAGHG